MYEDETKWFSQTLMTFKDAQYATDGYLRLSLSTNTKDYQSFSPTNLGLSISNGMTKVCNLNIQSATDLLLSLKNVITNPDSVYQSDGHQILKRFNKNQDLVFEFIYEVNNGGRVVRITIINSETDFAKIVIPYMTFFVLATRLKEYVNNYEHICLSLPTNFLLKELLTSNKGISPAIKSLPTKFVENEFVETDNKDDNVEVEKTQTTINDLDKFIGGSEMDNVDLPALESKKIIEEVSKTQGHVIQSRFVDKVLKNDLHNLIDLLTVAETNPIPIAFLAEKFASELGSNDSYKVLSGIDKTSYKSLLYISKLVSNTTLMNYTNDGVPIPSSTLVLKFKTSDITDDNLDFAYDLLMIGSYLRSFRRKIEDKITDGYKNGAVSYLLFRYYTDAMCFSFLEGKDIPVVLSAVASRFFQYDNAGFFDKFKKVLEEHNCIQTTSDDISFNAEDLCKKVINNSPFIEDIHNKLHSNKSLTLPSNNNLTIEQIINEVIPLEVYRNLGKDINSKDLSSISQDVLNMFVEEKTNTKPKKQKVKKDPETNLQRFIRTVRNQIPDAYKDDFNAEITKMGDTEKYDFKDVRFPLEEFGDDIIKALYIWDPKNDPKITKNYKYFFEKYENEIMTRDNILSINTSDISSTPDKEEDWSTPFDNLEF